MDLVLRLREARRRSGLTQRETAKRAKVGEKTISSFETGDRISSLRVSQLQKLLYVYGVTEEEFFGSKFELDLEREPPPVLHALKEAENHSAQS